MGPLGIGHQIPLLLSEIMTPSCFSCSLRLCARSLLPQANHGNTTEAAPEVGKKGVHRNCYNNGLGPPPEGYHGHPVPLAKDEAQQCLDAHNSRHLSMSKQTSW